MAKSISAQRNFRRFTSIALAVVFMAAVSYLGVRFYHPGYAATGGNIYLNPASGNFNPGSNVIVHVRENSGVEAVEAVQFSLRYDASQLQYVSLSEGDFPASLQTSTENAGTIRVSRGAAAGKPLSGDHVVASLTFKVLASSAATNLSFEADKSFQKSNGQNITQWFGTGSYTIGALTSSSTVNTVGAAGTPAVTEPVTLSYVMVQYSSNIMAVILMLMIVVITTWKLVLPRFSSLSPAHAAFRPEGSYGGYDAYASTAVLPKEHPASGHSGMPRH